MDLAIANRLAADVMCSLLRHPAISEASVLAIKRAIANGETPDYVKDALPFAAAFWERNFWKAVYYFQYEYLKPSALAAAHHGFRRPLDVVVLGVGSGADAAACLLWLESVCLLSRVNVTVIDACREQLDLARNVISRTTDLCRHSDVSVTYVLLDALAWHPMPQSIDLLLMSHVLMEMPQDCMRLIARITPALKPHADIILIERQRDPVWQQARREFALSGLTTHEVGVSREKFALFTPSIPTSEADITPSYVRGSAPHNTQLMRLVRNYFKAWLNRSSDALADVFTAEAVYEEKPGIEPPITGLDGIKRYWDANPGLQRNIQLTVHNVAYSDTVSVCTWSGQFDTPKQHIFITGGINFYLDPYAGRFHRLAEYFGTTKTPLAPT